MKRKKLLVLLGSVCLALVMVAMACAAPAPSPSPTPTPEPTKELPAMQLKLAAPTFPKDTVQYDNMVQTAEAITERTGGKITWTIFGPEIGDWTETEIMNKMGTLDYVWGSHSSGFDPRWNVLGLPFLASDIEGATKFFGADGVFLHMCRDFAADGGQYLLSMYVGGFGQLCLNTDPIVTPEQAEGVKIRVWASETAKAYVTKMGFTAVTIPWAEAPTAISTGVADGLIGAGTYLQWQHFRDICRTQIRTYDFIDYLTIDWNLESWNSLPEEYQKIIQEETAAGAQRQLDNVWAEETEYMEKLRDMDWEIVDMAKDYPDELAVWQSLARETWDDFDPIVGKLYIDKVREAVAEIEAAG